MSVTLGVRLGPFEITAKLGEGGMGEVWRARDTKLERDVAIKVLPAAFVEDHERLARFEREAKLLAQLNHPNIAHIYGMEASGESHALVMELVEGPTLAERLGQGALPIDESLLFARQIAEALEEAHAKGIVHRDLKPQNVKASREGKIKVLDFGLAKAMDPTGVASGPGSASQLAVSPTLTLGATIQGVILGTAAYMAPEQAKGMAVDKRADIWAFGVLLYEMLTGARLFAGDTVPETLAGVLKTEIDLEKLPDATPRSVRRLLRRCLERDPRNRLHDIADARLELDAAGEDGGRVEAVAPASPRRGLLGAGIAIGVAVGVALGVFGPWRTKPAPPPPSWKLALAPPAGLSGFRTSPKISPDGRSIAYHADGKLWTQKLDGLTPRVIPKSEGASIFTWSPDGGALAFATQLLLLRTLPNGDVTQVASLKDPISTDSGGLAWTADGTLVFSTGSSGLFAVPASGGEPRPLLEADKAHESDFHQVLALPDGKGVVFVVHRTPGAISAIDLFAGGQRRRILQDDSHGGLEGLAWAESGQLLYGVSGGGGAVWALPLDPETFERRGDPYLVAANVSAPSISRDGTLLLSNFASAGHHQLEIVGLDGVPRNALGDALPHIDHASFSPDGKRVAYCLLGPESSDVWVFDLDRGSRSRLWSNANCGGIAQGISWSADGTELAVSESDKETIHILRVDGSRTERELTEGGQPDLSRDGRWLVLTRTTEKTKQDVWALPLAGGEARPLLVTEASEQQPRLSPDGRYLAYVSDQTGHTEVHLCPFPEGAGRWQVSVSGGEMPRWSADGRRLFYLQNDDQMMEVDVDLRGMPVLSDPRPLFSSTNKRLGPSHGFDFAPDGSGFVTVELGTPEGGGGDLTLIRPWPPQSTGP